MEMYELETHDYALAFPLDTTAIISITASIKAEGLKEPIALVETKGKKYRIIDGQNRLQAIENLHAGKTEDELKEVKVACKVYKDMDNTDIAAFISAANFARRDLSALARAAIGLRLWSNNLKGLAGRPKKSDETMTMQAIGERVGVSRGTMFSVKALIDQAKHDEDRENIYDDICMGDSLKVVCKKYDLAMYTGRETGLPHPKPTAETPAEVPATEQSALADELSQPEPETVNQPIHEWTGEPETEPVNPSAKGPFVTIFDECAGCAQKEKRINDLVSQLDAALDRIDHYGKEVKRLSEVRDINEKVIKGFEKQLKELSPTEFKEAKIKRVKEKQAKTKAKK